MDTRDVSSSGPNEQIDTNVWSRLQSPVQIWLVVSITALSFAPSGWKMFWDRAGHYFDAGNYTTIAVHGYGTGDGLTAFYPLWPMLLRYLSFESTSIEVIGRLGALLSAIFFLMASYVTIKWALKHRIVRHMDLVLALMILNPLSIFRVLAFTESLFSLFLVLLIYELSKESASLIKIGLWSALLASVRPMFPFLMVASICIVLFTWVHSRSELRAQSKRAAVVFLASPLGYIPFGVFCKIAYGNFWRPFDEQARWDRKFGFHWKILTEPKVINGSNEVLVWDLIAFYGPFLLLGFGLWLIMTNRLRLSTSLKAAFLMAVLIPCAHAAMAFLTFDRFMSTGRHVLANPLPFICLLVVLQAAPVSKDKLVRGSLKFFNFASVVFLAMWWFRFSRDQWTG